MKKLQSLAVTAALAAAAFAHAVLRTLRDVAEGFHVMILTLSGPPVSRVDLPNYPGLGAFWSKISRQMGDSRIRWQPLYDSAVYPTAGTAQLSMFSAAIGGANSAQPGNAGNPKTGEDTNLVENGKLSANQAFFLHSIEVDFQPGSSAAANTYAIQTPTAFAAVAAATVQAGEHDLNAFYSGGRGRLFIGQNNIQFEDAPLYQFPPRAHFEFSGSVASNSATTAEVGKLKMRAAGPLQVLNPGLGIAPGTVFGLQLMWPVVVATPSGFNGRVVARLNGWLFESNTQ